MPNLDAIVKAYDIRGTVPDQLDAQTARALGIAFAQFAHGQTVAIAHDMRPSGPELVDAFQRGVLSQGVDVVNLGLASSDLLYYASANSMSPPQCSRRHTILQYNGIKFCLSEHARLELTTDFGKLRHWLKMFSTVRDLCPRPTGTLQPSKSCWPNLRIMWSVSSTKRTCARFDRRRHRQWNGRSRCASHL